MSPLVMFIADYFVKIISMLILMIIAFLSQIALLKTLTKNFY